MNNPDVIRLCRNCGHWYPEIEKDLAFCQEFLVETNAYHGCKKFYERKQVEKTTDRDEA